MYRISFFILILGLIGCKTAKEGTNTSAPTISQAEVLTVNAYLKGCEKEPVALYQFDGVGFKELAKAATIGKDSFQFSFAKTATPKFYYIGQNSQQKMPVIAGTEKNMIITGGCQSIRQTTKFTNSELNDDYGQVIKDINNFNNKRRQLGRQFGQSRNNPNAVQTVVQNMAKLDRQQLDYLDTLKVNNPYLARIAALSTYPSFQNNQGVYKSEIDYFADKYFQFADLNHADYDQIPYLFEATKNYAVTLSMQPINKDIFYGHLDTVLTKFNPNGRAYKYALGGMCIGLQSKNHPGFLKYGELFLEKYGDEDTPMIQNFKTVVNRSKSFMTGAVAPDFTQKSPEGEDISLSSLKGKVVLVDFWASWCGPCRRENPNVVRMYNKYKDQGFEILGVSLDKRKDPWVKAIEKDKLTWYHVSDLKGWKNEVAQMYSVTSVPHTVLLDREGRIVARNLRGHDLEAKVAEIIGKQ